jgi:hypothetical protein
MSGRNGIKYIEMAGKKYIVIDDTQLVEEYAELLSLASERALIEQGFCEGILTEEEKEQIRISKWEGTEGEVEGQIRFEEVRGGSRSERIFHYKFKRRLYLSTDTGRTYEPELLEKLRRSFYIKRGRGDVYRSHLEDLGSENPSGTPEIEVEENILERARKNYGRSDKSPLKEVTT